jgi:hypothetical protein
MGAGPYWPSLYARTNGSGYYAETWLHHALSGAAGFLYYNTLSYQLDGTDNQLFSDVLRVLDAKVGCAERRWVRDHPVSDRQAWVDGYVLSGSVLGEAGHDRRVWRFTPALEEHPRPGDPMRFVTSLAPLTLVVQNTDDVRNSTTHICLKNCLQRGRGD